MQFTLITFVSIVAVALAGPISMPERIDDITARAPTPQIPGEAAAMSNAAGDVVAFNSTSVYQAAAAAGQ